MFTYRDKVVFYQYPEDVFITEVADVLTRTLFREEILGSPITLFLPRFLLTLLGVRGPPYHSRTVWWVSGPQDLLSWTDGEHPYRYEGPLPSLSVPGGSYEFRMCFCITSYPQDLLFYSIRY